MNCIVPGCDKDGRNKLGIRCRVWHHSHPYKGKTSALWAPDAEAYLCDLHALAGAQMTLLYEPDGSEETTLRVIAANTVAERVVRIKKP